MRRKIILSCTLTIFYTFLTLLSFSQSISNGSWTQFRGNDRLGQSSEIIKAEVLPAGGPKLLWKKSLGSSFAEITVSGDRFYTMFSEKSDSLHGLEYIGAFEIASGNLIWKTAIDSIFIDVDGWGDGPRSTPAIGENMIYGFSAKGMLCAVDKNSGNILWKVNCVNELGGSIPRWGYTSSPLLLDEAIYLEVGGNQSRAFAAFEAKRGKVIWAKGNGQSSYESPIAAQFDGKKQILFANGRTLYSFLPNGDSLWTMKLQVASPTAVPLVFDNKIFISAVRTPAFIIAQVTDSKAVEALNGTTMQTDFNTAVYYEGHIYGFNIAALTCIDAANGQVKWVKRGFGKGSLIRVGDKLVILSDQGKIAVAKANSTAYTEIGNFQAIKGKSWTAPSFANGKLFVRNLNEMACFDFNF